MMQRSAIARIEASSCVTTTNVAPRSSRRSRISRSSPAEVIGSSPADGSSRNSSGGSSAIARAMPARLAMPPEISAGISAAGVRQADQAELDPRHRLARLRRQVGEHLQRQHDVLQQRHRAEQRARLEHHADLRACAAAPPSGRPAR